MRWDSASPQRLALAARAADDTAMSVQRRLDHIRALLHGLEPGRLGVSRARMQALTLGYDVYARILHDALIDVAAELTDRSGGTGSSTVDGGPR